MRDTGTPALESNVATVTVDVLPVNEPPVALDDPAVFAAMDPLRPEWVVAVVGKVRSRGKDANPDLPTGAVEVVPTRVEVLNQARTPPFEVRDDVDTGEDKRLSILHKAANKAKGSALTVKQGPSDGTDLTGVSHAECGISETGTLALLSGADNPTTLNFLPENHIVVVQRSDIAAHYEEIWPRLRKRFGKGKMPRTVNLITGPSRSADIEQTLLLGAHGPVRLHIIVIED